MGDNPFKIQAHMREQHLKPRPEPAPTEISSTPGRPGSVGLLAPKPKRKQCSLYLDTEMMERVKQVAHRRSVTIGAVIETCVRMSLEQLEG